MKLSVEIDGEQVPLAECEWVLREPCGCPQYVVLAVTPTRTITTEDDAWKWFYRSKSEPNWKISVDREAGWRVEPMRPSDTVIEFWRPCTLTGGGRRG